ncbi:ATP-binding protein [Brevundimonas sp.]|jgi:signal transduction histidine kinase/CheY-like chemotaxis protein|uniref:ATP-binding protein n=1 Tax=Brevundimonas sp. TaxID=1871086 RepID=UPI0035621822
MAHPNSRRLLRVAMAARARQWPTRLGLGAVIASAFFMTTGGAFAASWLLVYATLQLFEWRVFSFRSRPAEWTPTTGWCLGALALVAVNNAVFGAFAVRQAFEGGDLSLVSAALLIAGAIINGVIVSAGSRALTWASILPLMMCFVGIAGAAVATGHTPLATLQISGASLLFVIAACVASTQLARKLRLAEEARLAAERANRAKGQFLANMSHEIRTPLNGVVSMADLLAKSPLAQSDREMVEIIRSSGQNLTGLLSDILDVARIEAGEIALESAPFELGDMLRSVCALFSLKAREKGVTVVLEIAPVVDRAILGDGARLRQVVTNLVANAIKFTDRGEVRLSAELDDQSRLRLAVRDTGIGFDPAETGDLFGRFQQADGSITRRFGGSGLGLAIAKDLTQLMRGDIGYDSRVGTGSVFWILLPFTAAESPIATPQQTDVRAETPDRTLSVLVADDHETNLKVVVLILDQVGAQCTTVGDGAAAVAVFRAGAFDLILMDMQMPIMDGLTAVRLIREIEATGDRGHTPIAILSANALPEHIAVALAAGADRHVAKPVRPDVLIELVHELVFEESPG